MALFNKMIAKWRTVRKTYKAAAKKANMTSNSNEDKLELLKDFPNDIGMLISKSCSSISTLGKVDSSSNDKNLVIRILAVLLAIITDWLQLFISGKRFWIN